MKNKIIFSFLASSLIVSNSFADSISQKDFKKLQKEVSSLKTSVKNLENENTSLKSRLQTPTTQENVAENNLKWSVDFRTSVDNINYEMANGKTQSNDALLSNRLWLNMGYKVNNNVSFGGQLAYNKLFGQRSITNPDALAMDSFDWVSSENREDDKVRVRSAYIDYKDSTFFGAKIPWSFGIGRRPSNNGKLSNYREDDEATSPLAHISNAEFDGGNIKFYLESLTGLEGASFKFAAGRGMSSAESRFATAPYSSSDTTDTGNINMYAINLVPYKTAKLNTEFQYTHASNLIDITNAGFNATGTFVPANYNPTLQNVGALDLLSAFACFHGMGDGMNEYINNSIFFVSLAMSKTNPDTNEAMLGSQDSQSGYSYWIGTQMPSLFSEKGKWGVELNHGSKYWRSFTYAEDTAIGSKIAARGNAFELYFTEPIASALTLQLRYTYIDYDYSGSNGFFGSQSGTPMKISDIPSGTDLAGAIVDKAQDIRFYIRYKF
jgi:regulator of replication initiation timing